MQVGAVIEDVPGNSHLAARQAGEGVAVRVVPTLASIDKVENLPCVYLSLDRPVGWA